MLANLRREQHGLGVQRLQMPIFNIELRTQSRIWETQVFETESLTEARIEVARFVGQLLKDHSREIWVDEDWRVDVTDEAGLILFVMHLFVTNMAAMEPPRRP